MDEVEAVEVPPWDPGQGPPPVVKTFPGRERPFLWVFVETVWRSAVVQARHTYADGRVAYEVELQLSSAGPGLVVRAYWWDPRSMHR